MARKGRSRKEIREGPGASARAVALGRYDSPMPANPRTRRTLALGGLVLPIVVMMGLFAWAGIGGSGSGATALVEQFITAYNKGDCQTIRADVYEQPGTALPSCTGARTKFLDCTYTAEAHGNPTVPSGYGEGSTVLMSCNHVVAPPSVSVKVPSTVKIRFSVATEDTTGAMKITGAKVVA